MNPTTPPIARPIRRSLQRKLLWGVVALVVGSTAISTFCLNRIARSAMSRNHARNAVIIGQTLAGSLAGQMGADQRHKAVNLISRMQPDRRLAFVALLDEHGRLVHNRTRNFEAWSQYMQWLDAANNRSPGGKPAVLGQYGELAVHKTPVWNPPVGVSESGAGRTLEGYVVLAMHEDQLGAMIHNLWLMQVAAAAAICLVTVPIVVWGARRWTAPLRALLDATARLGSGWEPKPIDASSNDELGLLAESFNEMAATRYAAQKALEQTNEQLEQKVQQRTAELEQLNRRLENEIRDKDEFLRTVSHDLTTPLRNINGMASMLIKKHESQLSEDALSKLQRIAANVKVQTELINDLMDLSRLRTRPAKQQAVDLRQLVEQLASSMSYDLESNNIDLRISDDLPTVMVDRNRMQQVLQNLLDNAIKYMGDSEQRSITVAYGDADGEPRVSVADTGRGIDAKDLPTVFNVFRRGIYSGAAHDPPGRGIGLASVKAIVETMGGRVWVESQLGRGATFHFTLDANRVLSTAVAA